MDARTTPNAPMPAPTSPVEVVAGRRAPRRFALSPLNRRRWQNFKRNRRGYWAMWLFLVLFFVSLFAEFIANDKPFLILMTARPISRRSSPIRRRRSAAISRPRPTIAIRILQELIAKKGGTMIWPPIRYPLRHAQSRSADAGAVAADLEADRGAMQAGGREEAAHAAAATSNTTGSAPTIRAATWWRG